MHSTQRPSGASERRGKASCRQVACGGDVHAGIAAELQDAADPDGGYGPQPERHRNVTLSFELDSIRHAALTLYNHDVVAAQGGPRSLHMPPMLTGRWQKCPACRPGCVRPL